MFLPNVSDNFVLVLGKIYARVVCDRLRLITDAVLMDEQGGFRVRRGCVDQIFVVRQVTEKN